jgi:hypothetical protein
MCLFEIGNEFDYTEKEDIAMGLIYYIDEIVRWANEADKRIAELEKGKT